VTHVSRGLGSGGTQKALEVFVRNLSDRFETSVIGIHSGGVRAEYLQEQGHDVTILNSPHRLNAAIRSRDADIVHLHGSGFTKEIAHQIESANPIATVLTDNFGWPNKSAVSHLLDRYYFCSDMVRSRYFQLFDVHRTKANLQFYRRMYYPLDQSDFDNDFKPMLRSRLNIKPETPVIGRVARANNLAKWSMRSIDAFDRVIEQKPETVILLLNPPDRVRSMLVHRGLDDHCHCLDPIHPRDIYTFYDSIDVMVHTSHIGESFGYVIAEAHARRTPTVVDSTPMRDNAQIELVDHGRTGYVANSARGIADSIIDLLEDDKKRSRFGEAARQRALERFSPETVTRDLEREYLRLLGELDSDPSRAEIELEHFESEYKSRLYQSFGRPSLKHRVERLLWSCISETLPVGRYPAYHLIRYKELPS